MKYIKKVEDVTATDIQDKVVVDGEEPLKISLEGFILGRLSDPSFAKSMDKVLSAFQIKQALKESEGEDFVALETSDWENLVKVVKEPSEGAGYHPAIAVSLVPLMKAVTEATDTKE